MRESASVIVSLYLFNEKALVLEKNRTRLALALFCLVYVPLGVFLFGMLMAGRYAGEFGIFGLAGKIYGDLLTFELTAWFLVLSPALIYVIWRIVARLQALGALKT
jgi:hypothetical protein